MLSRIKNLLRDPGHMLERMFRSYRHARDLDCVQDHTEAIGRDDIVLFCCLRNEAVRIPYFLDYYRRLGVRHFLFVDNDSDDGFQSLVRGLADVSVWHTTASYKDANFGMHWLNQLLRRYARERWCITCDPDEFLVYPHMDRRNLHELADFLESERRRTFCCVMLDMYSDRPIEDTAYTPGDDPFKIAPYFDGTGYVQNVSWLSDTWVTGGVRRRVFFRDTPDQAPALNKIPFVKFRWYYSYFLSMHQLVPSWLNRAHADNHNSPTGCVAHFKYFSLLQEKVSEEMTRKQHWNDSFEYQKYQQRLSDGSLPLTYEKSVRLESWQQLESLGFLNTGQWF